MAKRSGKKIGKVAYDTSRPAAKKKIRKLKNNKSTNVVDPAAVPFIDSVEARVMTPVIVIDDSGAATKKKEENENMKFSGFIFLCSGKTKPECYVNRVFGLPAREREVVEKIKPGTKLFLFDFDVKLLYGVYEASSKGEKNLEPAAFGGRFPAQVKFKIYKDCLPLPESSFRNTIKDNYQGSKFSPELTGQQVRDLLSLFRPFVAPSSASLLPSVPNAAPELRMPPPASNGLLNPSLIPPLQNPHGPYLAGPMHSLSQQTMGPQSVQQNILNPLSHHLHPAPGNPYQFAESRQPYFSNDLPQALQEPYPRYTTMREVYPHDQRVGLDGGYHGLALQREREPVLNHVDRYQHHNSYHMPTASYGSSHLQTPPVYSGPSYLQPQPPPSRGPGLVEGSMPGSSYCSFTWASSRMR